MRIDKYLKLTRIIKRRQVAKEIIDSGRVAINNRTVKPSATVKVGDILTLKFSKNTIEVSVVETNEKNIKKNPDLAFKTIRSDSNDS